MSLIEYIHTDLPLKKTEYTMGDILGEECGRYPVLYMDGSPALDSAGIIFKKVPARRSQVKWNIPLLELNRYHVIHGAIYFGYGNDDPVGKAATEWLFGLIREHLRQGAKKFYYAYMWEGYDPEKKFPKMKKIDLAKHKLREKGFDFGDHTIWEFVDPSIES